jgi:flagellin
MAAIINTNITSLIAQNNLNRTSDSLQTTIQRLSSGLRVNSAADDASGYAIANRMDAQIRGMAVATRNANDGISFSQTATGALSSISNDLQRMRELAVQAANGSNSSSDTALLNQEFSQLQTEVARVQSSTTFNGVNVFSSNDTIFQIGANSTSNDRLNMQANALTTTMSTGTLTITDKTGSTALTDLTGILTSASATANALSGSSAQITYLANAMTDAILSSQKISSASELELNNNISFAKNSALATGMSLADFVTSVQANLTGTTTQTYGAQVTFPQLTASSTAMTSTNIAQVTAFGTAAGATLSSVFNNTKNYVTTYAANGTDSTAINSAITTAYNNAVAGNMTATGFATALATEIGSLVTSGTTTTRFGFQATTTSTTNSSLVATQTASSGQVNAQAAIAQIDLALSEINSASAVQGAIQNRFTAVISNLQAFSQSQTAAKSRIVDADFAAETARLSKYQILNQAGTAMLSQANQLSASVLSLLK